MQDEINKFKRLREDMLILISKYPPSKRGKVLFGKWSLKDVLAHLNTWMVHDIDCLKSLKEGREPYWEPDVDDFNKRGVEQRKGLSWDDVFIEFGNLSDNLTRLYEALPSDLWKKEVWKGSNQTGERFLRENIDHWQNEHLAEMLQIGAD